MAKLVLRLNGVTQEEYELDKGRLTIGRRPDSDIHINNLAVSGRHALIITTLDDSFIEDLGSTNGTYVNGKLIKRHAALKDGDIVVVGKHELKYINKNAIDEGDELEKTMIIKPGSARAAIATAEAVKKSGLNYNDAGPTPKGSMPLGRLTVLNGPIVGKKLELTKALITLGKPGKQVAIISRRPVGYFLTHLEGNGDRGRYPLVNGASIGPKACRLHNNDLIELAGIKLEFTILS